MGQDCGGRGKRGMPLGFNFAAEDGGGGTDREG